MSKRIDFVVELVCSFEPDDVGLSFGCDFADFKERVDIETEEILNDIERYIGCVITDHYTVETGEDDD